MVARDFARGDGLHRRKQYDDVARTATNHRAVVAERRPYDDILQRDAEAGLEVAVCGGSGEPVAQAQLFDRLGRWIRPHLLTSADNAPPEHVASEMHASLKARRKQTATVDFPAAIGPVIK